MSLPKEVAKKVKLLEIKTRKLVNSTFAGSYHSAFKGQGMTFADFREYVPGDEVRSISWALSARTGKTYVKKFEEERELTLMLVVDVSASLDFGGQQFKGEAINHMSALLGFSASKNNDHVGLLLFSDQVEKYIPPKKGRGHIQRLLTDLYSFRPKSTGTDLNAALSYLKGVLKKKANIFIFSDFLTENNYASSLRVLSKKHETAAVVLHDPFEKSLPNIGLVEVFDPESQEMLLVDTDDKSFRAAYETRMSQAVRDRDIEIKKSQVTQIDVANNEDFLDPLIQYFKRHSR